MNIYIIDAFEDFDEFDLNLFDEPLLRPPFPPREPTRLPPSTTIDRYRYTYLYQYICSYKVGDYSHGRAGNYVYPERRNTDERR